MSRNHDGEELQHGNGRRDEYTGGHLSANQAFCQIAPKLAAPAASNAMNMSGKEVMEGIRKKLTPSQEPNDSIHQAKSRLKSTLRRIW